jgi:hypothetical protein
MLQRKVSKKPKEISKLDPNAIEFFKTNKKLLLGLI